MQGLSKVLVIVALLAAACGAAGPAASSDTIARGQNRRLTSTTTPDAFIWYFSAMDGGDYVMTNLVGYEETAGGIVTGGWGQRTATMIEAPSLDATVSASTTQIKCVVNGVDTTCSPGVCDLPFWEQCG